MSKHKIVALYWRYQYWAQKTSLTAYKKTIQGGHGALMLYKHGEHILKGYPFDSLFLSRLWEFLYSKYQMDRHRFDNRPPKEQYIDLFLYMLQNCTLSQIDSRFEDFRLDLYLSWTHTGFNVSGKRIYSKSTNAGLKPIIINQKNSGNIKSAPRTNGSGEFEMIREAIAEFIMYNTYWNNETRKLVYADKNEGIRPWCKIPAISYGNRLPGLDYNKIIAWWAALSNKRDFKYTAAKDNCCKVAYLALVAGGSDTFYKNTGVRLAWNPTSLYEHSTNLSTAIYKSRIKGRKINTISRSQNQWNTISVIPDDEIPLMKKKEFQQKSALGRFSHRYSQLTKIDKFLDEISKIQSIQSCDKSSNTMAKIIKNLLQIKLLIAEIFYKRPKTKRFSALLELLMQINNFLNHCWYSVDENVAEQDQPMFRFNLIDLTYFKQVENQISKIVVNYSKNEDENKCDENVVTQEFTQQNFNGHDQIWEY